MIDRTDTLSPILKWAGGKRWLVSTIAEMYRGHQGKTFVEPFVGGMAATLGLMPKDAYLFDSNPHLINFYNQVKQGLAIEPGLCVNVAEQYCRHRSQFNYLINIELTENPECAQLFYYLNRTGFNGLCRFNKSGGFNVPFGRHKTINYLSDFSAYTQAFSNWIFACADFTDSLQAVRAIPDSFVYADPPYDNGFTAYTRTTFSWDDQVRLAELLASRSQPTVVSNLATQRILELYKELGFKIKVILAPRSISNNGNRTPVEEMLAWKNI